MKEKGISSTVTLVAVILVVLAGVGYFFLTRGPKEELPRGQLVWSYITGGKIWAVATSADGDYSVAGGEDQKVYFFGPGTSSLEYKTPLWISGVGERVKTVDISENGTHLVVGSSREVYFFKKFDNRPFWKYHTGPWLLSVAISADSRYIMAGTSGKIYLFRDSDNMPLWNYEANARFDHVAISTNGDYLTAGSGEWKDSEWIGGVYLFVSSDNAPLWVYQTIGEILSIDISENGEFVVASDGHAIYLFSNADNIPLWSYRQNQEFYRSVAISADGKYIVAGCGEGYQLELVGGDKVYLFSNSDNIPLWSYHTGGYVRPVVISAEGNQIVTISDDTRIYTFGNADNIPLWSRIVEHGAVYGEQPLDVSADGNWIITLGDRTILFFQATPNTH